MIWNLQKNIWLFNRCEGFRRAHELACSHVPCDEFLNNPYTPWQKRWGQLRPKNHPSVRLLSSAYGENYNKIQPIPNLSQNQTRTWGTFQPGTNRPGICLRNHLWIYESTNRCTSLKCPVLVILNDPKQFYLCRVTQVFVTWNKRKGIVYVKSEIVAWFLASSSFWL